MIHRLLPCLLFLSGSLLQAQALLVLPDAEDPDALHFNERFIARNRVASISGERMVKRDGQPMRTEPARYLYRFDEQGRMTYANNSFGNPGTGRDTTSVTFTYDTAGHVMSRLRNDLAGHFSYRTEHDAEGRPVSETYARIENLGTDRYSLVPGVTTEISDEHFRYTTINDTTWRKTYFNYLGPTLSRRDLHAQLARLSAHDRGPVPISERRSSTVFTYNEGGHLASRTDRRDMSRSDTVKRTWSYDQAGNVVSAELWHGDRQKHREEFMYEEQTMLLKARLRKDMDTGIIHVIRYRTELR
ncbi:MAG: hypothetical protein IPG92_15820 [Flavobacteriales bacterium]|nr:hypothetical protein [Flavobacteriales bacterium]